MFCRADAIRKLGGMDESFFFYGEDIEFCHRFAKAGLRCHYDPGTSIIHLGGGSSDPTKVPAKQKNVMMWQARYQLQHRCYGPLAALWLRMIDIVAFGLRWLKLLLKGRKNTPEFATQRDVLSILLKPLS
jgi:N-acetylglucosaminyl-diphospho-decaprenol L-rhamnosyltransferase